MPALALVASALKVPPGHAVLRADDHRVGPEQRAQLRREGGEAVRLDAEDHDVDGADRREIAGDGWRHVEVTSAREHAQAAIAHRLQMRTARVQDHVDVGSGGLRQTRADVASNRAGAGDDDLHEPFVTTSRPAAKALATTPR
jgi:hypothetical protein